MYAIITAGASQHRVAEGEKLRIDLVSGKKNGDKLTFDKVLFVERDGKYTVGQPLVAGAKVEATVVDNGEDGKGHKGPKLWALKRRPGDWTKERGHRQRYTIVKIEKITV
jgi:large subunit ribosomal protein L21